jgi:tetratricopeptide (TPR) repeat protein
MRRPCATPWIVISCLLLGACGEADTPEMRAAGAAPQSRSKASAPQLTRDFRFDLARRALEEGRVRDAIDELDAIGDTTATDAVPRPDFRLLRARALAGSGDAIGSVRAIEAARERFGDQAAVYATAAEIHAAAGRFDSAEGEIRRGLAAVGPTPEISRARGVLMISRQGGTEAGLSHLLEATAADPDLPFCDRPLAQAHLVLGNRALAAGDALTAAFHARAAFERDASDEDVRTLRADAALALGDTASGLELYEDLLERDPGLRSTVALHNQRGAMAALLEKDRPLAVRRYLRALELGLPREDLGFGVEVLAQATQAAVERGIEAHEARDLAAARAAFEEALRCSPDDLRAQNHLAVVRFEQGDYAAAAELWSAVVATARTEGLELPDPVHLNLARALHQDGRPEEVRAVLEAYLAAEPRGAWREATSAMLEKL